MLDTWVVGLSGIPVGRVRAGRLSKRFPGVAFVWDLFEVDVEDRGLEVGLASDRFRGAWALTAMLVYPESAAPAGEAQVERVLRSVELLPADLLAERRRVPHDHRAVPMQAMIRSGPSTVEPGEEIVLGGLGTSQRGSRKRLSGVASPGLSADLAFAIRSEAAWEKFSLSVDPFTAPEGSALSGAEVDLWAVRDRALRYNEGYVEDLMYTVQPDALDRRLPDRLVAGRDHPFWLRVRVPEDAPPETYRSTLRWSGGEDRRGEIPIELRVLPFEVARAGAAQYRWLRAKRHTTNRGLTAALKTGFEAARKGGGFVYHPAHLLEVMGYLVSGDSPEEVDWEKTMVFLAGEPRWKRRRNLYLNIAGRDPHGVVPAEEREELAERVAGELASLKNEYGEPLFRRVKVMSGEGEPDIRVEFNNQLATRLLRRQSEIRKRIQDILEWKSESSAR